MTLLHAHAHYICIVCAKYQKASVKALVQADFLLYALFKHKHNPYLTENRKKWLSLQGWSASSLAARRHFDFLSWSASFHCKQMNLSWSTSWENLFLPYANNKGADQPAHPHSLISIFFVRFLDSTISLVSISEISSLYLASEAEQAGLSLHWSQTPETGFLVMRLTIFMSYLNNKGADQPAHPWSLISAFVVRCLDSVMSLISSTKISSFMLASVAEQANSSLTWSETPEDTFSHVKAQMNVPLLFISREMYSVFVASRSCIRIPCFFFVINPTRI